VLRKSHNFRQAVPAQPKRALQMQRPLSFVLVLALILVATDGFAHLLHGKRENDGVGAVAGDFLQGV
jgi:hypothetical protein